MSPSRHLDDSWSLLSLTWFRDARNVTAFMPARCKHPLLEESLLLAAAGRRAVYHGRRCGRGRPLVANAVARRAAPLAGGRVAHVWNAGAVKGAASGAGAGTGMPPHDGVSRGEGKAPHAPHVAGGAAAGSGGSAKPGSG